LPVRDQRWGRTGERRARESGARWGVAASELGLRETFIFIPVGLILIELGFSFLNRNNRTE